MHIFAPNYTQIPNDLLDYWLPLLGELELKVILFIMRKTFGWHKVRDQISLSQFQEALKCSESQLLKVLKNLSQNGLIKKEVMGEKGKQKSFYSLVIKEIPTPAQNGGGDPRPKKI